MGSKQWIRESAAHRVFHAGRLELSRAGANHKSKSPAPSQVNDRACSSALTQSMSYGLVFGHSLKTTHTPVRSSRENSSAPQGRKVT